MLQSLFPQRICSSASQKRDKSERRYLFWVAQLNWVCFSIGNLLHTWTSHGICSSLWSSARIYKVWFSVGSSALHTFVRTLIHFCSLCSASGLRRKETVFGGNSIVWPSNRLNWKMTNVNVRFGKFCLSLNLTSLLTLILNQPVELTGSRKWGYEMVKTWDAPI